MPKRLTQEEFIEKITHTYGNRYDFSRAVYRNFIEDVIVRCPTHGTMNVKAYALIRAHWECPMCRGVEKAKRCYGADYRKGSENKRVSYLRWSAMMHRCYHNNDERDSSYSGCSVCEEWHDYENFRKWFSENYVEGYCLDKDLIKKGNKIYSPDTCCFLPPRINIMFKGTPTRDKLLPRGVRKAIRSQRYRAAIGSNGKVVELGVYDTIEEAFNAYKHAREKYLKQIATEYYNRGEITKRVYDALMRWEVEITD